MKMCEPMLSHTVLIIDNSKSMATCDVTDDHNHCITRSQAVFSSLIETYFPYMLEMGPRETDLFSLIVMQVRFYHSTSDTCDLRQLAVPTCSDTEYD